MAGADRAGPVADAAIRDLEAVRGALTRSMVRLLMRLDTAPGSDSLIKAAQTQAAVYRQIVRELDALGVKQIQTIAGARALQAVEATVGMGPVPADVRAEIDRIVKGQNAEVAAAFREARDEIRRAINVGTTSGSSLAALTRDVGERIDVATTKAQAAVDAAIMGAGRHAVVSAAKLVAEEDGVDLVYVYVGPQDVKTRPFCRPLVGKAVTEKTLGELDNGQGLDVATFAGGYNCRHSWAPMSREDARERGIPIVRTRR